MAERGDRFVEQLARLRAARVTVEGLPSPFKPHPIAGELERPFVCTGCGSTILVGPFFEDKDPESFVGIVCGCFERLGGELLSFSETDETSATGSDHDDAARAAGTAGNGREGGL